MKKITPLVILAAIVACSNPDSAIDKGIAGFKKGERDSGREIIIENCVTKSQTASLGKSEPLFIGELMVRKEADSTQISKDEISVTTKSEFSFAALNENGGAISDGHIITLLNQDGEDVIQKLVTDSKKKIDFMVFYKEKLVYLYKQQIFSLDASGESKLIASAKELGAPLSITQPQAEMKVSGNILSVIIGGSGYYNITAFDLEKSILIFKDNSTSFKYSLYNGKLYYIKGGSGDWKLFEGDTSNNDRKKIATLPEIEDVSFSKNILFVLSKVNTLYNLTTDEKIGIPKDVDIINGGDRFTAKTYGEYINLDPVILYQTLKYITISLGEGWFEKSE